MSNGPPPYVARETHAQAGPPIAPLLSSSSAPLEFAETSSVSLEWRLSGLRVMYDSTKGDAKSKCIKSAVFGDADNLWEVLWYPNSGVAGGDFASLYLSCVPTPQEREAASSAAKWTRKGLWWFRFEIRSSLPDDRTGKPIILASKDASDHTFAVKTANWGWQQFAKRDTLFSHPAALASDSFVIACTISAQSQPPAGYWLGMGIPPAVGSTVVANLSPGGKNVGSGGGLSAWSGGEGASGGVAGGTMAAGGPRRVVPRELVHSVGCLLDDPLYSDIEFTIPPRASRKRHSSGEGERSMSRKIYANKRLLCRYEYFEAMFHGGFREVEGFLDDDEEADEVDALSDSDLEDEIAGPSTKRGSPRDARREITPSPVNRRPSTSADSPEGATAGDEDDTVDAEGIAAPGDAGQNAEETAEEDAEARPRVAAVKRDPGSQGSLGGLTAGGTAGGGLTKRDATVLGPKKTRVMIRDAAWSTWWAVLYWIYTDIIYFAPLTSSFDHPPPESTRPSSMSSLPSPNDPRTRKEWIAEWMEEHGILNPPGPDDVVPYDPEGYPIGPRPVSAKAIYRLADKLDLPALKLRAFQHICGGLTAGNIPAEVFSRFSSTFEDVRKVQIAFFLKHWSEIKKSETMMQIWQQIRVGKHVGFEEVWPLIVSQLEFKSS